MSRLTDGVNGLRVIEFYFNWSDTPYFFEWQNLTPLPVIFARVEIINGTVAGTTTAAVATITTPNCDYVATMGSATMPVGMVASVDQIGEDVIPPLGMITGVVTTPPSAAKDAKCRLFLEMGV